MNRWRQWRHQSIECREFTFEVITFPPRIRDSTRNRVALTFLVSARYFLCASAWCPTLALYEFMLCSKCPRKHLLKKYVNATTLHVRRYMEIQHAFPSKTLSEHETLQSDRGHSQATKYLQTLAKQISTFQIYTATQFDMLKPRHALIEESQKTLRHKSCRGAHTELQEG